MITLLLTKKAKEDNRVVIDPLTMRKVTDRGVKIRKINSYWRNRITDEDVEIQKPTENKKVSK